jgi:radical SAM protein with 4Fe4S-binding SPASM domain
MIHKNSYVNFSASLVSQLELTYRCNLNCIHCYCKVPEDRRHPLTALGTGKIEGGELDTAEWKNVIDEIEKDGCLWLTLTGGEPLLKDDFLEIYSYAKSKGFIITIFTNGLLFTDKIINYLVKSSPFSIEITLNGITKDVYETITQVKGSFAKVIDNIKKLTENKLPVIIKANCLKQNKHQIHKIKAFSEELLGKHSENKYRFKYDPMIYPGLNGDTTPTDSRLCFDELLEVKKQDLDIWMEYEKGLHNSSSVSKRNSKYLYRCNAWTRQFFINPYGRLKFCEFSDKFSVDLKTASFKEGFHNIFPQILNEEFKSESKCKTCDLRPVCYYCPARAYLETGDEEAPVPYYCELAKATEEKIIVARNR